MFKILDLYIGRTILTTVLMTVTVLMILSGMFRFIDQLRLVGRGDYDMLSAGLFTLFSVPGDLILFFPMAALIGGLVGLGMLASNSELVVMQAAGLSRLNIINGRKCIRTPGACTLRRGRCSRSDGSSSAWRPPRHGFGPRLGLAPWPAGGPW